MNIEQRLAAVEDRQISLGRSLRRWRLTCAGLASVLLVTIGVAATPGAGAGDVPDLVKAKAFEVVGDNGKPLAHLGHVDGYDGDGLQLFRRDGKIGVAVDGQNDGGIITLFGDHQSIVLRTYHDDIVKGVPTITIYKLDPTEKLWAAP